jgi:predicted Zn-dependent protease
MKRNFAGVMAHEIGHVVLRRDINQATKPNSFKRRWRFSAACSATTAWHKLSIKSAVLLPAPW